MDPLANLGMNVGPLLVWASYFCLPFIAWVYLYRQGAPARDLIFWGAIALFIPVLGPLAAFIGFRARRRQAKAKHGE